MAYAVDGRPKCRTVRYDRPIHAVNDLLRLEILCHRSSCRLRSRYLGFMRALEVGRNLLYGLRQLLGVFDSNGSQLFYMLTPCDFPLQ